MTVKRNIFILHLIGVLSSVAYGVLAFCNRGPAPIPVQQYFALFGCSWLLFLGLLYFSRRREEAASWAKAATVWAIVFRVIGFAGQPILEDDFYRYLWDGRQMAHSGNPYATAPRAHFQDPAVGSDFQSVLDGINYPDIPTIYAPVLQYAFVIGYWLHPAHLWPLKLIFLTADIAILWMLWRIGGARALLIYSWCPLVIQEIAFTCHPDVLGAFFVIAALYARKRSAFGSCAAWLGLSIGTKVTGLIIAPFFLKGRPVRDWLICLGTLCAVLHPFWVQGSWGDSPSLIAFAKNWEFNSGGLGLAKWIFGDSAGAAIASVLTILGLGVMWFRQAPTAVPRGDWIYGWFFLWAAVVQPWYLIWALVWIALRPSYSGLTALAAVSLSYLTPLNLGKAVPDLFAHPVWLRPLEYGIVVISWAVDYFQWRRSCARSSSTGSPTTQVPTY